jgi:hypothetical protein
MDRGFTGTTFLIWSGLLIWAADFLFVYVFAALACARGFADVRVFGIEVVSLTTVLVSGVALAATALLLVRIRKRAAQIQSDQRVRFVSFLVTALAVLGAIAIAWTTLPPLLLNTNCAPVWG